MMPRLRTAVPAGAAPTKECCDVPDATRTRAGGGARLRRLVVAAVGRDARPPPWCPGGSAIEPAEAPREPWLQGDPADSVYRAAREALNRREVPEGRRALRPDPARFPRSGYAPDALYWQAFALYRLGGEPQLRDRAGRARAGSGRRYPDAATRGDAAALERADPGRAGRGGTATERAARYVTEVGGRVARPRRAHAAGTRRGAGASGSPRPPVPPDPAGTATTLRGRRRRHEGRRASTR